MMCLDCPAGVADCFRNRSLMSGGINLNADSAWIVSGWVASNAIQEIVTHLDGKFRESVKHRLDPVDLYPGSLAVFSDAPAEEVAALYEAAVRARAAVLDRGPAGWHQPEFFNGYLARLHDL